MKNLIIKLLLIMVMQVTIILSNSAQMLVSNPQDYSESITVLTDRQTYFVEDLVQFYAAYSASDDMMDLHWSKVLYVEIISYDGKPFFQSKFPIIDNKVTSKFIIPRNLMTGNYYIKAYTKWMRNYAVENYFYMPITIINPFNASLIEKPLIHVSEFELDTIELINAQGIHTSNDSLFFAGRTNAVIDLTCDTNEANKINYVASICENTLFSKNILVIPILKNRKDKFNLEYFPESKGISISGKIVDVKTSQPLPFAVVNLTITGSEPHNYSVYSDSIGRFLFALPDVINERELFISADESNQLKSKILIDSDFCTRSIDLPFIPFEMDIQEWKKMNDLSLKHQVFKQFGDLKSVELDSSKFPSSSFYENPSLSIKIDDYIEMPRLEDYFYEVISLAGIREVDRKKQIQVMGPYGELRIYKPLVLLDQVAISNIDALLDINPKFVDKIEVLNYPYLLGNITYGGIVNIFSKKGDLAGIKLPNTSLIFDYKMFNENICIVENQWEKAPQLSNNLYWNSNISFINKKETIEFNTGDNYGDYILLIRGIDSKGNIYQKTMDIKIKSQS